jgi:methionine synthase II (cobalamin-independent)
MASPLPLFPTTVIGSMPRPQYVKDLLQAGSRTGSHDAGWQRRMDDAVRFAIGMQATRMALTRVFRRFFLPYQPSSS